jgi:hypothetical protein
VGEPLEGLCALNLGAHFISRTHSPVQKFYFGRDSLLRRHDYCVAIAGSFAAAQLTSKYIEADGVKLPSCLCYGTGSAADSGAFNGRHRSEQPQVQLTAGSLVKEQRNFFAVRKCISLCEQPQS